MQDPIYARLTGSPRPGLRGTGALLTLAVAGLWIASGLTFVLPGQGWGRMALVNTAYYLPFVLMPALLYAAHRGAGAALRPNPIPGGGWLPVILLALMSVYVASAVTYFWEALLARLGLSAPAGLSAPGDKRSLAAAILSTAAMPAVCEELLFRGVVLSAWESRGTALALAVSTAFFALMHGDVFGLPAYLLVGGIAGYLTLSLDSVYAGITFHTVYNAACLFVAYAAARLDATATSAAMTGAELAQTLMQLAFLLALMAALILSLHRRAQREGVVFIPRIRRPLARAEWLWTLLALAAMAVTALLEIML